MKYLKFCIFIAILSLCLQSVDTAADQEETSTPTSSSSNPTYIIPIEDMIDFGLSKFIKRGIETAKANNAEIIIFEIDTYGGLVDSALEITKTITSAHDDNTLTVGYVTTKAISAGALIALSCNELVMNKNTTLGDCAPIVIGQEGPKMLGEKFQSPLRAEFRKLAERNGYPVRLAESMVSQDMEVTQVTFEDGEKKYLTIKEIEELSEEEKNKITSKKVIIEKDKLLTMYDKEAKEYGFAKEIVENEKQVFELYNINENDVVRININWAEQFVRFLDKIAPILMMIGLIALYTEFKAPGFGLPGIIAIICFALLFGGKYMVGLANNLEILLFCLGVVLLAVELFLIPGFGITGISGLILIAVSLYLAGMPFVIPEFDWQYDYVKLWIMQFGLALCATFVVIAILARYLPRSPLLKKIILSTAVSTPRGYTGDGITLDTRKIKKSTLLGLTGKAMSDLRPAGKGKFGKKFLDVVTEGDYIEKGSKIKIVDVQGNRIVVKSYEL